MPLRPAFKSVKRLPKLYYPVIALILSACATDRLDLAPPSPDRPWPIPKSAKSQLKKANTLTAASNSTPEPLPTAEEPDEYGINQTNNASDLNLSNAVTIAKGHQYDLAGLIDLAQRLNPETRMAWESARQAALAVGLTESAYLPQITAQIMSGWQYTPMPIPKELISQGYFTADTLELIPTLTAKWLLFDFGQRAGNETAARANAFIANVSFTGAHQKLIYIVSRDYFALEAARGRLTAVEQSLAMAKVVQDTVEMRRSTGLATEVELAQARQQLAQAQFNRERAKGSERNAYSALIADMGVAPASHIETADSRELPLPESPGEDLDQYVQNALINRPDILAAFARVKAAKASLSSANASFYPTIGLETQLYENIGAFSTMGSPYYAINRPGASVMLKISLPLFDGGDREAKVAMAESTVQAAHAALDRARTETARQVIDGYDALHTSYAEYKAALTLVKASETAYQAALDSYRSGVGTYIEVVNAETALSQARFEQENSRANIFTAAATLAFATGSIKQPETFKQASNRK